MLRAVKQAGQWVADGWPIGEYLAMMAKCAIAKSAKGLQLERVRYIAFFACLLGLSCHTER